MEHCSSRVEAGIQFPWKSENGISLCRRKAAIFSNDRNIQVQSVKSAFDQLDFETQLHQITEDNIANIFHASKKKQKF